MDPQRALDILELVFGPLEILLAILVYWAAPKSTVNRILAVLLLLEGLTLGGLFNASESFASPRFVYAAMSALFLYLYIAGPLYLLFITYAIDTPLTQRVRRRWALVGSAVLILGAALAWAARAGSLAAVFWSMLFASLAGLVLASWSLKRAQTSVDRSRARSYLAAFLLRDVSLAVIAVRHILSTAYPTSWVAINGLWISFWASVALGLFPIPLVYGLLQGQLLDLDRRIKLRRSLSGGSTLVVVLLVPLTLRELALNIQSVAVANTLSLAALSALLLGLGILWRTTTRVAARLVPTWDIEAKKIDVYKAALAEAGDDEASQRLLQALRSELRLSDRDHALLLHAKGRPTEWAPGNLLLGRFHVLRSLDSSRCFLAEDRELRRKVVIKKVHTRPESLHALAKVSHPNVVSLYDVLHLDGETLLVMESLQPWTSGGGARSWRRTAADVLSGVDALHQAGMVHGAIHPRKLLVRPDGTVVLGWPTTTDSALTLPFDHDDTPYLSPERKRGGSTSVQDDLWGTAATLYDMWTGKTPRSACDESFDGGPQDAPVWLLAALSPHPSKRPRSAREMLAHVADETTTARPAPASRVPV